MKNVNETLKIMKTEKRTLENKWFKSGTAKDYKLFRNKCNEYTQKCNDTKIQYYSNSINECNGNQSKLYRLINKWTFGNKNTPYPNTDTANLLTILENISLNINIFTANE